MSQRFSESELAAEFWFASGEFNAGTEGYRVEWFGGETRFTRNDELRAAHQVATLKRFATLPHAHKDVCRDDPSGVTTMYRPGHPPTTEPEHELWLRTACVHAYSAYSMDECYACGKPR